jgi:hypothetical protein
MWKHLFAENAWRLSSHVLLIASKLKEAPLLSSPVTALSVSKSNARPLVSTQLRSSFRREKGTGNHAALCHREYPPNRMKTNPYKAKSLD